MVSLAASLTPLLLAGLLGWSGAGKLLSRSLIRQAESSALAQLLRTPRRAARALRAVGALEVLLAAALLAAPTAVLSGAATALLGAGFLGYLGYAKAVAPESSCGCSAREDTPVTWRSFARAGAVALGGTVTVLATVPWWQAGPERPGTSVLLLAVGAAALAYLSATPDRPWLLRLRRLRLRLLGNPLPVGDAQVPVSASVELLERSLAWETASPIVRSGLLEHWDEAGWRILHYTGTHRERPVSVLFALDVEASLDRPRGSAVRVSVVDPTTEEVMATELLNGVAPGRHQLPVVS
jgi:hypothetical protein